MSEDEFDLSKLDTRVTAPADVGDVLEDCILKGKAQDVVLIIADKEGDMHLVLTDMTTTELMGFLEIAKMNFYNSWCEQGVDEEEGECSCDC